MGPLPYYYLLHSKPFFLTHSPPPHLSLLHILPHPSRSAAYQVHHGSTLSPKILPQLHPAKLPQRTLAPEFHACRPSKHSSTSRAINNASRHQASPPKIPGASMLQSTPSAGSTATEPQSLGRSHYTELRRRRVATPSGRFAAPTSAPCHGR